MNRLEREVLVVILGGVLSCMQACSRVDVECSNDRVPICFSSFMDMHTKADVTTASLQDFYCIGAPSPDGGWVQNEQTVADHLLKERVSPGVPTSASWPESGACDFVAIYPYDSDAFAFTPKDFWNSSFDEWCNPDCYLFTFGTGYGVLPDIVVARSVNVPNGTNPVQLTFSHVLACIDGFRLRSNRDGATVRITSIEVNYVDSYEYSYFYGEHQWTPLSLAVEEDPIVSSFPDDEEEDVVFDMDTPDSVLSFCEDNLRAFIPAQISPSSPVTSTSGLDWMTSATWNYVIDVSYRILDNGGWIDRRAEFDLKQLGLRLEQGKKTIIEFILDASPTSVQIKLHPLEWDRTISLTENF